MKNSFDALSCKAHECLDSSARSCYLDQDPLARLLGALVIGVKEDIATAGYNFDHVIDAVMASLKLGEVAVTDKVRREKTLEVVYNHSFLLYALLDNLLGLHLQILKGCSRLGIVQGA